MAYLAFDDTAENPYLTSQFGPKPNAVTSASAAAIQPGGTGNTLPTTPGSAGAGEGKYVNFERILNANRDAAEQAAGNVTGQVDAEGQGAYNGINAAYTQFANDSAAGTQHFGTENPSYMSGATYNGLSYGATSGPEVAPGYNISPEDAKKYAQQTYSGPSSLMDAQYGFSDLEKQAQTAQDDAGALKDRTGAGLETLLRKYNKGPISNGDVRTDAALMGYVGAPQFDAMADKWGGLEQHLTNVTDATAGMATEGQKISDDTAHRYEKLLAAYEAQQAQDVIDQQKADAAAASNKRRTTGYGGRYSSMTKKKNAGEST